MPPNATIDDGPLNQEEMNWKIWKTIQVKTVGNFQD